MRVKLKKIQKPKVNARCKSNCSSANIYPLDKTTVGLEELAAVCNAKDFDVFIVD